MRIEDFAPQTKTLNIGGRRFVCHPPTLAVLHRFLSLYWAEVAAAATACSAGAVWELGPIDDLLPLFTRDERCDAVLAECVDGYDVGDADLRSALCRAVLSLCDVPRIISSLNLDAAKPMLDRLLDGQVEDADRDNANNAAIGICLLAERLSMTPMAVMQMPYEAYLTARDAIVAIDEKRLAEARRAARDASRGERSSVYDSNDLAQLRQFYGLPVA